MAIWFTSDHHYGHNNIRKFTHRPYVDLHSMNSGMTDKWNSVVQPNDTVYHLGDFVGPRIHDPIPYLKKLNGNIILISGNHDSYQSKQLMPLVCVGFMHMKIGRFKCILTHRPVYPLHRVKEFYRDHNANLPNTGYDYVISGHIHNNPDTSNGKAHLLWTGISLNLSVEVHDYTPVSMETIMMYLNARENYKSNPTTMLDFISKKDGKIYPNEELNRRT